MDENIALSKKSVHIGCFSRGKKPTWSKIFLFPKDLRGLAVTSCDDVIDGSPPYWRYFFAPARRFNGNNVRKRPKIGHLSGPIETFQCIKSNRGFDIKIWKVFIYLHLDFLGN
jgi:hypothetical protein